MDLEQQRLTHVKNYFIHLLRVTSLLEGPEAFVELSYRNADRDMRDGLGKEMKGLVTQAEEPVDSGLYMFYHSSKWSENKMTEAEYNRVKTILETRKTFYLQEQERQ